MDLLNAEPGDQRERMNQYQELRCRGRNLGHTELEVWIVLDMAHQTLPWVASLASHPSPTPSPRPWFAGYMGSRSAEAGGSGTDDAEYYCRLALDGDRTSWRIAGSRGKFESRKSQMYRRD